MEKQFKEALKNIEILSKNQDYIFHRIMNELTKIDNKEQREFLENSLKLAKKNELKVVDFVDKLKEFNK